MRVLDLFSGIGGFSLGVERAGWTTVAFCEIEKYPRKVLAKHWPGVPIYEDVRLLNAESLKADGITVDVITAGFPCQDISNAGKGAGIEGERSGLWSEVARLTGELQPRYVILENVAAMLHRGMGRVLGDLASIGYGCEWHCIPASHIGAPHRRDRVWVIAYPDSDGEPGGPVNARQRPGLMVSKAQERRIVRQMADSNRKRSQRYGGLLKRACKRAFRQSRESEQGIWFTEPSLGRVANGVPRRVDRLKGLGNAVVPQIPQLIAEAINEHQNPTG